MKETLKNIESKKMAVYSLLSSNLLLMRKSGSINRKNILPYGKGWEKGNRVLQGTLSSGISPGTGVSDASR